MFWKRKPKCTIELEDKKWIEDHLNWLDNNVVKIKNHPTILPTKEFFDWQFNGGEKDAEFVLNKVAEYCNVNPEKINLDFYSEESIELDRGTFTQKEEGTGTAGLYVQQGNKYSILIEVQQLKRPNSLIATMAHELSHYVLLGQKDVYLEGEENEWLTDLLAITFGFGIFIGNTKFEFNQWQSGDGWGGWQYSSQGYLPQQITAYAMAEIEIRRTKEIPEWIDFLKNDFKNDFKKSMKFLISN
jgi:hypothetical protein